MRIHIRLPKIMPFCIRIRNPGFNVKRKYFVSTLAVLNFILKSSSCGGEELSAVPTVYGSYRACEVSSKAPKRGTGYQHRLYCLKLLPFSLIFTYQREDDVVFSGNFLQSIPLSYRILGKDFSVYILFRSCPLKISTIGNS